MAAPGLPPKVIDLASRRPTVPQPPTDAYCDLLAEQIDRIAKSPSSDHWRRLADAIAAAGWSRPATSNDAFAGATAILFGFGQHSPQWAGVAQAVSEATRPRRGPTLVAITARKSKRAPSEVEGEQP